MRMMGDGQMRDHHHATRQRSESGPFNIGTPNQDRWNAYDELRHQLVHRGIPAEQVRYMHQAKTDVEKARLFAAARAGHAAVLIGSTEKMGVGTNVQARAIALHHLDCPWRPSEIAQRDGR
ncbi:hypothetical protein BH10ACT5_BH10ACT5_00910 [soil metagenome]